MSKLDDILARRGTSKDSATGATIYTVYDYDKAQIKALMNETYNNALQRWIDRKADNLDVAFEQEVEAL